MAIESRSRNLLILFDWDADCLRYYDPDTNELRKFHSQRFNHLKVMTAISVDSYIYVLCPNKSVHRLNFRDRNSNWERMRDMIGDYRFPRVVTLSGSMFVIGSTSCVEKFDPAANQWTRLNNRPEDSTHVSLVSMNESIFCIGGWDGKRALKSFCKFTPSSSEWVDLEPLTIARRLCGALAVDQRIIVMGGWRDVSRLNEVETYDIPSGRWTSLLSTVEPHGIPNAHYIDGWVYLVSRISNSNEVEKYNIENDKWYKVEFNKDVELFKIFDSVSVVVS